MKNNFQIIVLVIFVVLLVVGVLMFSGLIGPKLGSGGEAKVQGTAIIWGTLPQRELNDIFAKLYTGSDYNVMYVQKSEETYREALLEAFSSGTGPDLFFVNDQDIASFESKLIPFTYEQFNQRDFKSTFITEAEIFGGVNGYSAIPVLVDPIVMYWNRGIFDSAGIADVPKTWDEVKSLTPTLTKKTDSGVISQSSIALSFMDNVLHKREILSLLMFQQGNAVSERSRTGGFKPLFQQEDPILRKSAAEIAVNTMIEFSDPLSPNYTWNRGLNNDLSRFTTSQLAMYLGSASELFEIQEKNPNLNFDVAFVPQMNETTRVTYGKIHGVALSKFTQNSAVAYQVVFDIISPNFQTKIASALSLPPVRRDLLAQRPPNPYAGTFFDASLSARGWLDPNEKRTNQIFKDMFDAIFSNSLDPRSAVSRAASEFSLLGVL